MFFTSHYMSKLFLVAVLCLLGACAGRSAETTYYILNSDENFPTVDLGGKDYQKLVKLQLRQVDIPNYLDRNAIVTREADGVRLHLASFNSWGEPLGSGAQRVIAEVLVQPLLEHNVLLQPLDDRVSGPLQIFIQVQRFDGPLQGDVVLEARWTVRDENDYAILSDIFVDKISSSGTYESFVQAQSTLLKRLALSMVSPIVAATKSRR